MTKVTNMNAKRAMQLIIESNRGGNPLERLTDAEYEYVYKVWSHMPGYACAFDALCAIANDASVALSINAKYTTLTKVMYHGVNGVVVDYTKDEHGNLLYVLRLENGNPAWALESDLTEPYSEPVHTDSDSGVKLI